MSSVVASRCFMVDSRHGNSMVPVADLFNHSSLAPNVNLLSDDPEDEDFDPESTDVIDMKCVLPVATGDESLI